MEDSNIFTAENVIFNLIMGVGIAILLRYVPEKIQLRWIIEGSAIKRYLNQLENLVRQLPFIYKDLDGDVLNDFVEVDVRPIDNSREHNLQSGMQLINRETILRSYKQLFLLGNAGVGKTTFMRYVILLILDRKRPVFLHQGEKPIPIYVPLKAVSNTGQAPIIRYVTDACGVPIEKLYQLAREKRLFLFLDGYDEITTGNEKLGERNFIRDELNRIFPDSPVKKVWVKRPKSLNIDDIYSELDGNRVWFSSRREFYNLNALEVTGSTGKTKMAASLLRMVEITGISKHRAQLAAKIFNKYREKSPRYREVLDEELFLQSIDGLNDREMVELSMNPLFLTVMCYLYANKAIEASMQTSGEAEFNIDWVTTSYDLILSCVDLLLRDLDRDKARNLKWAPKKALLARRNAYYEEKIGFLKYFALHLFLTGQTLFNKNELAVSLRFYMEEISTSPLKVEILQSIECNIHSTPDIGTQLIYDGIFTIADQRSGEQFYDFPHRRFKEVLACAALTSVDAFVQFLGISHTPGLSEFVRLVKLKNASNTGYFYCEVLTKMLNDLVSGGAVPKNINQKLLNYCDFSFPSSEIGQVLGNFLAEIQSKGTSRDLTIPSRILEFFQPSIEWKERLLRRLATAWKKGDNLVGRVCISLAGYYCKTETVAFINSQFSIEPKSLMAARLAIEEWARIAENHDVSEAFASMNNRVWLVAVAQTFSKEGFREAMKILFADQDVWQLDGVCLFRSQALQEGGKPDEMDQKLLAKFCGRKSAELQNVKTRYVSVVKLVEFVSAKVGKTASEHTRVFFANPESIVKVISMISNVDYICTSTVRGGILTPDIGKAELTFARFTSDKDELFAKMRELGDLTFFDKTEFSHVVRSTLNYELARCLDGLEFKPPTASTRGSYIIHKDEFAGAFREIATPEEADLAMILSLARIHDFIKGPILKEITQHVGQFVTY